MILIILFSIFALLLLANYLTGVFRLSLITYISMFLTAGLLIASNTASIEFKIRVVLLILSIISGIWFYYCIKNEKSGDVERLKFDIYVLLKTGELPDATDSTLLKEGEKEKIDEKLNKLQKYRDKLISKK